MTRRLAIGVMVCAVWVSTSGVGAAQTREAAVLAALDTLTQSFVEKDHAALARVLHDDLSYGHASGRVETKDDVLKDVANPQRVWESWTLRDPSVRLYGSTAIVRCISDVTNGAPGKTDRNYTQSLWVLLDGPQGWQVVSHQRVRLPLPGSE